MDPRQTRGYRNRNPGNIEHQPANRWQGLADPPIEPPPAGGGAPRFARFVSHEYGIRALAMLLTTYQDRHGLRTIRGIVARWAPGRENDTEAYIAAVARLELVQIPPHPIERFRGVLGDEFPSFEAAAEAARQRFAGRAGAVVISTA